MIKFWNDNYEIVVVLLAIVAVAVTAVKITLFLLTVG
jgi:hypothetical protein